MCVSSHLPLPAMASAVWTTVCSRPVGWGRSHSPCVLVCRTVGPRCLRFCSFVSHPGWGGNSPLLMKACPPPSLPPSLTCWWEEEKRSDLYRLCLEKLWLFRQDWSPGVCSLLATEDRYQVVMVPVGCHSAVLSLAARGCLHIDLIWLSFGAVQ